MAGFSSGPGACDVCEDCLMLIRLSHSARLPMTNSDNSHERTHSRRAFIKTSTAAAVGATVAANLTSVPGAYAAGSDTIKVGLIGCGGRGTGAVLNVLSA